MNSLQKKMEDGDREIRKNLMKLAEKGVLKCSKEELKKAFKHWDDKKETIEFKKAVKKWKNQK